MRVFSGNQKSLLFKQHKTKSHLSKFAALLPIGIGALLLAGYPSYAQHQPEIIGFTLGKGYLNTRAGCPLQSTYRAYWIGSDEWGSVPHEIGEKAIRKDGRQTETFFYGWTLDGRAIVQAGHLIENDADHPCDNKNYPFMYEIWICTLGASDNCEAFSQRNISNRRELYDRGLFGNQVETLQQVPADQDHFYFVVGEFPTRVGGGNGHNMHYRIPRAGGPAVQVGGGVGFHMAEMSPTDKGVEARAQDNRLIIRKYHDGVPPIDLTGSDPPDQQVAYLGWSPKGDALAFARKHRDNFSIQHGAISDVALLRWDLSSSQPVGKSEDAQPFARNFCPGILSHASTLLEWSLDANNPEVEWLYFTACYGQRTEVVRWRMAANGGMDNCESLTGDGGDSCKLSAQRPFNDSDYKLYPAGSSTGRYVAMSAGDLTKNWQLYVMDVTRNPMQRVFEPILCQKWLADNQAFILYPHWRPTGASPVGSVGPSAPCPRQ